MTDVEVLREAVRDWVGGSQPTDEVIDATVLQFDGTDNQAERAALRILRRRLADMKATKWAVDGDYSQDASANLKYLAGQIADLEQICGVAVGLPVLQQSPIVGPGSPR